MRKIISVILIFLFIALLSGCGDMEVTCRLTGQNSAYMEIKIDASKYGMGESDRNLLQKTFENLAQYWKSNGLSVDIKNLKQSIILTGSINKQASSQEEAYDDLISFMTSDISPFTDVTSGYRSSFFSDKRFIAAKLDLSNLVDMEYIESLPETQKYKIDLALDEISGRVVFDIPGGIIDYIGNIENGMVIQEISLDNPIEISITTEYQNINNINEYQNLNLQITQEKKDIRKFVIIIGVLLLVVLISIILLIVLSKRKNET